MDKLLAEITRLVPQEKKFLKDFYKKIIKDYAYLWEELDDLERLRKILLVIVKLFLEEHKDLTDLTESDRQQFMHNFKQLFADKDALLQKGRKYQIKEIEAKGVKEWVKEFEKDIASINKIIEAYTSPILNFQEVVEFLAKGDANIARRFTAVCNVLFGKETLSQVQVYLIDEEQAKKIYEKTSNRQFMISSGHPACMKQETIAEQLPDNPTILMAISNILNRRIVPYSILAIKNRLTYPALAHEINHRHRELVPGNNDALDVYTTTYLIRESEWEGRVVQILVYSYLFPSASYPEYVRHMDQVNAEKISDEEIYKRAVHEAGYITVWLEKLFWDIIVEYVPIKLTNILHVKYEVMYELQDRKSKNTMEEDLNKLRKLKADANGVDLEIKGINHPKEFTITCSDKKPADPRRGRLAFYTAWEEIIESILKNGYSFSNPNLSEFALSSYAPDYYERYMIHSIIGALIKESYVFINLHERDAAKSIIFYKTTELDKIIVGPGDNGILRVRHFTQQLSSENIIPCTLSNGTKYEIHLRKDTMPKSDKRKFILAAQTYQSMKKDLSL